jgi:hypothetical protein
MPIWTWVTQHRGWSIGMAMLLLLVAGIATAYYVLFRTTSTPIGPRQAIKLYRDRQGPTTTQPSGLPATGVYEYHTTGQEGLSIPGMSRRYPDRTPMIVTAGRCATVRWEPLTQHIETIEECRDGAGGLELRSSVTVENIAGVTTRSVMTCPTGTYLRPPNPVAGMHWSAVCRMGKDKVVATGRVDGDATLRISGSAVPALRTELDLSYRGSQTGTNPTEYWWSPTSDLILREREAVHIAQAQGPLGAVDYSEEMLATVTSLRPEV